MSKRQKSNPARTIGLVFLGFGMLIIVTALLLRGNDVILLNPKGFIAREQYKLLLQSIGIMLLICIPTLTALYYFAWKYRESNGGNTLYNPRPKHKKSTAFLFWAMPTIIMLMLVSLLIPATKKLVPQNSIESDKEQMVVQVVALRWKWLFIYPEHNIATINFVQIPVDTPVRFELTADETAMSSFWIPHLGGMLYAMTEHVNPLHLMADTIGDYDGGAAEINGNGFAGMRFTTRVSSQEDFDAWITQAKSTDTALDTAAYATLVEPTTEHEVMLFGRSDPRLYSMIISKYGGSHSHASDKKEIDYEGHGGH